MFVKPDGKDLPGLESLNETDGEILFYRLFNPSEQGVCRYFWLINYPFSGITY